MMNGEGRDAGFDKGGIGWKFSFLFKTNHRHFHHLDHSLPSPPLGPIKNDKQEALLCR